MVEGIIYRFRTGIAWRDLPAEFGPWQTVWKRHKRYGVDCTWDRIHAHLIALADSNGDVGWDLSIDSTINRAHQHATTLTRTPLAGTPLAGTRGPVELHESGQRTTPGAS
ncbi:transposase [Nocardioides sp. BSK12Z-4]|uniref:Transposase n=1 Tax=Nocardioides bruguierae TaxID=2945102 RepID=A0A9X2DC38_9ACTN|nr:transposase [Nocardioides bruguierae]